MPNNEMSFRKLPLVMFQTSLARSTIYAMIQKGEFPSPVKLSERSSAWISSEIDEWMQQRISESRKWDE